MSLSLRSLVLLQSLWLAFPSVRKARSQIICVVLTLPSLNGAPIMLHVDLHVLFHPHERGLLLGQGHRAACTAVSPRARAAVGSGYDGEVVRAVRLGRLLTLSPLPRLGPRLCLAPSAFGESHPGSLRNVPPLLWVACGLWRISSAHHLEGGVDDR